MQEDVKFDENFKTFYVEDNKLNRLKYFEYLIKDRNFNYTNISKEAFEYIYRAKYRRNNTPYFKRSKKKNIYIKSILNLMFMII